ncbi:hypothetical protein AK812_SmicGene39359, partial [Symbiodinium microadriaticum]
MCLSPSRTTLRHRVELFVLDAAAPMLRAATQRLAYDYGPCLFLVTGDYHADPELVHAVRDNAPDLYLAFVASCLRRGDADCPGHGSVRGGELHFSRVVAGLCFFQAGLKDVVEQEVQVSAEVCGAVPLLAAQHGMTHLG